MKPEGQGRLPRVFFCRTRDETSALDLVKQREKRRSADKLPRILAGKGLWFSRYYLLKSGAEKKQE